MFKLNPPLKLSFPKRKQKNRKSKKAQREKIKHEEFNRLIYLSKKDCISESLMLPPINKDDCLFKLTNDLNHSYLNRGRKSNETLITEGYANAALCLFNIIIQSNNNLVKDGYIFPALFCMRQYIELALKDSIHYLKYQNNEISDMELGYVSNHKLMDLWKELMVYIRKNDIVKNVGHLIHELEEYDNKSMAFRYPFSMDETKTKIKPHIDRGLIDIDNLKERFLQLYRFFEGINSLARVAD